MNAKTRRTLGSLARSSLVAVGVAVVSLALSASPALADGKGYKKGYKAKHDSRRVVVVAPAPAPVVVAPPRVIHRHQTARYQPYFHHRYKQRGRYFVVYHFPVWTPAGVVYQPYVYRDGVLLTGVVHISRPRLHISVGF
jgi:hypothetical protein